MKIPHAAWVVVAAGGRFVVLENEGDEDLISLNLRREGETVAGEAAARTGVAAADWDAAAKERFAKELAAKLHEWAQEKAFERLVIVADPSTLGDLRTALPEEARRALLGEIGKDLTREPIEKIEKVIFDA